MALVVGGVSVDLSADAGRIIGEMNRAAAAVNRAAGQMQTSTSRFQSGFARAERSINASVSRIGQGFRSLQGTLALFGLGLGIREVIRYADSYKQVEAQLRLVTGSAQEASAVQERLFQSAQNLGVGVEALNTIFIRTARNAESLGVSQEDTIQVTEALAAAVRVSGASAAEAQNSLIQLSQSFASGVLRGDELRSISEQLPPVLDAVAAATGRTRQEVINFARENGLAADLVIESVGRMRDTWVQQAATMGDTVEVAMTRIQNAIQRVAGQAGEQGAFQPLIDSLNSLAATLESGRVASALASFAAGVVEAANLILNEFADVANFLSAIFEGRFKDAFAVVEARALRFVDAAGAALRGDYASAVDAAINRTEALGESINKAQIAASFPPAAASAAAIRAANAPPQPLLELRAGTPAGGAATSSIPEIDIRKEFEKPSSPFRVAAFEAPAPFDPTFTPQLSEQFGPPTPPPGFLAEEQRGQEMIAQNEALIAQYATINAAAATFSQTLAKGFTDAITGAQTFGDALRGIVSTLVEAVLQAIILQTVTSAIGTAGGGGILGSIFTAQPRALGGPVGAYRPYMVGERGPELFVPSRAGQIVPNSSLGGGGSSNVINIDARQSTPGTAAAAVAQAVRLAPNAVANAGARGMMGRGRAPF